MQDKKNIFSKVLLSLPVFMVIPIVAIFDCIIYFVTRPACLTCNTLPEFLQTASLTVFLLSGIGYTLKKDRNHVK